MTEPMTRTQLRDLAQALDAVEPSPQLGARLHATVADRQRPTGGFARLALAGAAVLAVGVAVGWSLRSDRVPVDTVTQAPAGLEPAALPDGVKVVSGSCTVTTSDAGALSLPAGCRVALGPSAMVVDAWSPTTIRPTARGVAMQAGLAAFAVDSVPEGRAPVEVDVGGTVVRVIGTRFVIGAQADAGHLDLVEGRVELVRDGEVLDVEVGRRVSWERGRPLAVPADTVEPEPEPEQVAPEQTDPEQTEPPAAPTSTRSSDTSVRPGPTPDDASEQLTAALERVARHRRQRQYDRALAELDALSKHRWDRATGAVLSYERGTLLEASERTTAACAHWARHLRRFHGVGPADVAQRRERLACSDR
ncbi:MAG: FecR family protein [Deltaproteobacteria bacterium]|nr:FecR family protein [Deltaproteobacteria bacterium]